ncbi:UbiA family prenyltransferase, partial [Winogradskyella sp.]
TVTPFFAIFIYYQNFELVVFAHAIFLFLLVSMRELTKDLENIKGDLALDYKTIPVMHGEKVSKSMLTIMAVLTIVSAIVLILFFKIGHMYYFFYLSIILLLLFLAILWKSSKKPHYLLLHNMLKFIIVLGVFSILLIDVSVVLNRI